MVLSSDVIEEINYIKDIDIDFNIKLLLLCSFVVTALVLYYFKSKIKRNNYLNDMMYYFMNVSWVVILLFFPMYSFLLLRSVDISIIMNLVFGVYSVILGCGTIIILWWGGNAFMKKFFNINLSRNNKKCYRNENSYRRAED